MASGTRNGPAVDLGAAQSFLAGHGRLLDRRRFDHHTGHDPDGVLAALAAYGNPDGGFGWGLEPDLRSPESQPAAAMHALEVLAELAPVTTMHAERLCDWLDRTSRPDGGLPFACPIANESGCAPWWRNPDTTTSNLQMTAQVAANAHLVARHDAKVAAHPWLVRATIWCIEAIDALGQMPFAYEFKFAIRFALALPFEHPRRRELLEKLLAYLPPDGIIPVRGGADGEHLSLLDCLPRHDDTLADLIDRPLIVDDLRRLAGSQEDDGGWTVTFPSATPAAALEWRGIATLEALLTLHGHEALVLRPRENDALGDC